MKLRRAALLVFLIVSASTVSATARDICDIADEVMRNGGSPLDAPPAIQPVNSGNSIAAERVREMLPDAPADDFDDSESFWVARFDYDQDGIDDFIITNIGGTANCSGVTVYKGMADHSSGGAQIAKWDIGCARFGAAAEFVRIDGRVYYIEGWENALSPIDNVYDLQPLPGAKDRSACRLSTRADLAHAAVRSDCGGTPVCDTIERQARGIVENPTAMLAGRRLPRFACDIDVDYEGAWAVDIGNDGTEPIYVRQFATGGPAYWESFLASGTRWKACKGYPIAARINPAEHWGISLGYRAMYDWLNFIRVDGLVYLLLISNETDHSWSIDIRLVRNGEAKSIGTIRVEPAVTVDIKRYTAKR